MRTSWLVVFVILIFVFIKFQIVWLAILLGIVIVLDLISMLGRTGKNAVFGFAKGAREDVEREYKAHEEVKPKYPSQKTFVSILKNFGEQLAEEGEKHEEHKKANIVEKLGEGSEELIEKSKELFKK